VWGASAVAWPPRGTERCRACGPRWQRGVQGSWLEIGASISHFIIASGFIVFLTGLFYLSHLLVGAAVEVPNALALYKKRQM